MKQVPCCTSPSPSKMRKLVRYHLRAFRNHFFSVFDPAVTIKMWVQKSLVTVMLSLWLSFLAILVQISGKVPYAWKWHKATWNQLICLDSLLLTSSQLSDKVKGFFWKCELWFSHNMVCSSQEWSHPLSLKELSAEGSCVEPSQEPVNCIYMYLCFLTDSLLAACVGESCEGLLSLPPVFSENTQIVFCVVRATSLALGECILILAPASNRLLISD